MTDEQEKVATARREFFDEVARLRAAGLTPTDAFRRAQVNCSAQYCEILRSKGATQLEVTAALKEIVGRSA